MKLYERVPCGHDAAGVHSGCDGGEYRKVDEPLYRIDYDHLDMHDVVKAAKIKSVLVRVNGADTPALDTDALDEMTGNNPYGH